MFKEWLKEFGINLVKLLIGIVVVAALIAFAMWVAQVMVASLFWGGIIIGVENLSGWMSDAVCIVTFIIFLVGIVGLGFSVYTQENKLVDSGRDRYEVLLNEKVDMEEFYSKYEIIEQRDKIWVIEDKEAK